MSPSDASAKKTETAVSRTTLYVASRRFARLNLFQNPGDDIYTPFRRGLC